jgi:WD40 repeat protein
VDEEGREDGGRTLVSTSMDKTIRIWDMRAGRCETVMKAFSCTCMSFSCEDRYAYQHLH